ncbi:YfjI family protein [Rhodoblastus sp. 17X3]|uniref:YfjI family protein n=1 Tax=Rhodoblastus sp. 17X3 TaxID=3047026 RepID=UPI0024B6D07A|nr:YfjI family protein [Rhodoblastus sp. 17X3]MDI9849989.1 YfjI family protein [Rhodoblastus sp. 17X3]
MTDLSDYGDWPPEKRNAYFANANRERHSQDKNGGGQASPAPLPLVPPAPAAQPYPIEALGPVLSGAANSIAAKCQCAPALAAQSVLAVAALAAQKLADVHLPYGQTRPLSLFLVTVAASGDRKSTTDNEALAPVRAYERKEKQSYEIALESWRIAQAAWAAQHRKIENDKALDRIERESGLLALGPAPAEPIKPLLTAPEPTVEALAKFWAVLPGALGLFSAEGGQMTGGHGFGPDHRLKTAAALSTLWDGSGIRRLRAGDGITDLPGRRLALHLMVQPDAAAAFLSDPILRDQGLLSRLLIAAPETLAGSRLYHEPTEEMAAPLRRYFACILDLLERPAPAANVVGNELTPRVIELSAEARGLWVRFHDAIEKRMAPDQSLEGLRDVGAKAAENAARIAGVLTIVANAEAQEIDGAVMGAACKLMSWYLSEALRLSGAARQTPALRNAVKLSDWLRAKGKAEFALRDILNSGPNVLRSKAAAEQAIAQLEEHGHIGRRGEGRGARWIVIQGAQQ